MTVNAYPEHLHHHQPQQPSQMKKKKKGQYQSAYPDPPSMTTAITTTTDNSPRAALKLSTFSSSSSPPSSQQLAEQTKINHQYNSSLLASSSSFLSILLRDMSVTTAAQQRLLTSSSPTLTLSRSSSSLTLTHQPSPSSQKEVNNTDCYNYNDDITEHHDCRNTRQQQHRITATNIAVVKDDQATIEQLQRKVEKQEREIALLKSCLAFANQKLQDANDKADKAIQARRQTENELEDLSAQLFEQANEMVAKERRAAKEQNDSATHELEHVRQLLDRERSLRRQMTYHSSSCTTSTSTSSSSSTTSTTSASEDNDNHCGSGGDAGAAMIQPTMDTHGLAQFRDFVQRIRCVPIDHVHRLPFVKQCLEQDIYPCLQRMKKLSTRKLLNSLVRRPCHIVNNNNNNSKSETIIVTPVPSCCSACGTPFQRSRSPLPCNEKDKQEFFLLRLNDNDPKSTWHRIDRPCKERLVAVSNFYEFVRHLHLGLQGQQRSIESLFYEMVWLRLYMFWARSGILTNGDDSNSSDNDSSISTESTTLVTISRLFDARCSYLFG